MILLVNFVILIIYTRNNIGPNTDPCGIPMVIVRESLYIINFYTLFSVMVRGNEYSHVAKSYYIPDIVISVV